MSLVISSPAFAALDLPLINECDSLADFVAGADTSISLVMDTETGNSRIRMDWEVTADNDRGYFDWLLPEDPDFTGLGVQFDVMPPSFITEISCELIDTSGKVAEGWYWNVQQSWKGRMNTLTVMVGNQSGATSHTTGPGDITSVVKIRFDERGSTFGWTYNEWDMLMVTPEPATLFLLGVGALWVRKQKVN